MSVLADPLPEPARRWPVEAREGSTAPRPLAAPAFVALEGLDGCGKSTVARLLARRLDAELLKTPPAELDDVRGRLDALLDRSPQARPLFYASMVAWVSDRARANLAAGRSTVVDRYWLSTLAYATARGDGLSVQALEGGLLVPHATFFLAAGPEVRWHRMNGRSVVTAEDARTLRPDFESALLHAYQDHGRRWCRGAWRVLDAVSEDADGLVLRIDGILREEFP